MKIAIYGARPDEKEFFVRFAEKFNHSVLLYPEAVSLESLSSAEGCEGIVCFDTAFSKEMAQKAAELGVKYISTRTAGFGNIDVAALNESGIKFARVPSYSPNSVAEFEVLASLMLLRKVKTMMRKARHDDFTLTDIQGLEVRNLTLGFMGTGNIGKTALECFRGFRPKAVLAYDLYPDNNLHGVRYTEIETLLQESDLILLNTPLTPDTRYLIKKETLALMKPSAFLVNAARGGLVDTAAVLDALDAGRLAGYAADVYEHEDEFFYNDFSQTGIADPLYQRLKNHPKALFSPHYAFFTDEAVSNMAETSLANMEEFQRLGYSQNEVLLNPRILAH